MDFKFAPALKVLWALLVAAQLFLSSAPGAIAQPIGPCVLNLADIAVPCTRDINPCGNPSFCQCPPAYSYDASVGKCIIEDIRLADGPGEPVEGKFSIPPQGICTADINVCGYPTICQCPGGSKYSDLTGSCEVQLGY
ncbi:hypothetical protein BJP34_07105 [Moorena producens PAL-8-15-08-1]|uniref:EGF-like domain-containing protein n=1 Tax=Moorena producens PAL-8-15-08-1 TaxID=1458985 RepID=A0A1D8TPE0_9CYAN|nr:hypothetical protein [Moorena producens]AOW99255.1 hypothetical protein BJP34_07105 [Moorena producens PAL-8-15-08-1]